MMPSTDISTPLTKTVKCCITMVWDSNKKQPRKPPFTYHWRLISGYEPKPRKTVARIMVNLSGYLNNKKSSKRRRTSSMQLVEQHIISKNDPRYQVIDQAAFASKNLYNAANYIVRQSFIHEGKYLGYAQVYHLIKHHEAYQALPRKVSNDVLRLLHKNWVSFFEAIKAWRQDPSQFLGKPKLPKYKDKVKGRNILIYDIQALSRTGLERGVLIPSQLGIEIPTKHKKVKQVRIIPRHGFYVVEAVYEREPKQASVNPALVAGIDIGLNNLVALTSNKPGFTPLLVNGRPLKSINQYYNKERARLQSQLTGNRETSNHLERL